MSPEPEKTKQSVEDDLSIYDQLPAQTKEVLLLDDQNQKTTGPERVPVDQQIRDKAK